MRLFGFAAILLTLAAAGPAHAQQDADDFPGGDFFYDGGAIGLVYVPLAIVAAVELGLDPPDSPRLFSPDEGGSPTFANTVPEPYVGIAGAVVAAAIFLPIREGRWFHVKGMAQSVSVTLALTSVGKNLFGRHRPHWSPESNGETDTRRSFPSGHSSTAFSIASYGCLFLHRDGPGVVPGLACGTLLAAAGLTAYSRVRDSRHHGTDVIAGAMLGTVTSAALFAVTESRYQLRVDLTGRSPLSLSWGGRF